VLDWLLGQFNQADLRGDRMHTAGASCEELLFRLLADRYEHLSVLVAHKQAIGNWAHALRGERVTAALLAHHPRLPPGPVEVAIRSPAPIGPQRGLAAAIREIAAEQRSERLTEATELDALWPS
jgi:hypothetical protein